MQHRWQTVRQAVRRWRGRIFGADNIWRAVVAGLLALAVAAVGFSIWQWDWLRGGASWLWDWLQSGANAGESNSTTLRNIGLGIAGIVALIFAFWRSRIAERQADTAQRGLLNERYQKGAEMLGSTVLSVRLGGISALQSLAQEHPKRYYLQIMRLLCEFVRYPTPDLAAEARQTAAGASVDDNPAVRQDVQAAMDAIGACRRESIDLEDDADDSRLNLAGANLQGIILPSADLSGANLLGAELPDANLSGANLCKAWLDYANLSGTELSSAYLIGVHLSYTNLSDAWLSDANLSDAWLSDANLSDAFLSGAMFSTINGSSPAIGLTQTQLDKACADPDDPPHLDGVLDSETGKQLVWRGKSYL